MNDKQGGSYKNIEVDQTKGTSPWEGWGTALKPAHEPICLARKPFTGTVAQNVLKYGTGGINIDKSRVGTTTEIHSNGKRSMYGGNALLESKTHNLETETKDYGRFPANLLHDGSDEVVREFPQTGKSSGGRIGNKGSALNMMGQEYEAGDPGFGDSGSAARYFKTVSDTPGVSSEKTDFVVGLNGTKAQPSSMFYCPKASKSERDRGCEGMESKAMHEQDDQTISTQSNRKCLKCGKVKFGQPHCECDVPEWVETMGSKTKNNHPTVKPLALMKYLIQMITPEGGTVLDPFAGSGSTLVAAKELGYDFIGIEMTEEYIPIIEARLNGVKDKLL
jgi:site-specific DNA-methyltransferase (adenine-specific)